MAMDPQSVKAVRKPIEAAVAERLSNLTGETVAPELVIAEVTKQPPARKNEGSLLIRDGRRLVPLENRSVIFGSISEKLSEQHLQLYAPLTITDETRRRAIEEEIQQMVIANIAKLVSPQRSLPLGPQAEGVVA